MKDYDEKHSNRAYKIKNEDQDEKRETINTVPVKPKKRYKTKTIKRNREMQTNKRKQKI